MNIDGQYIADVENLKYLRVMLSASGSCDDEQRIEASSNVVRTIRKEGLDK